MLKVKLLNPLATAPTIGHPGEDLGYDVYALRVLNQPLNADGTPVLYSPPKGGRPTRMDMQGNVVHPIRIEAGRPLMVETGIAVHFTKGDGKKYGFLLQDRSSMAKKGIFISGGVIDEGYRGEIKICFNLGTGSYMDIWPGDKIAQLVPVEVHADETEVVETLEESSRGEGGFGSTDAPKETKEITHGASSN